MELKNKLCVKGPLHVAFLVECVALFFQYFIMFLLICLASTLVTLFLLSQLDQGSPLTMVPGVVFQQELLTEMDVLGPVLEVFLNHNPAQDPPHPPPSSPIIHTSTTPPLLTVLQQ